MIVNKYNNGGGSSSGGTGSVVSWRQDLSAGTQIAQITINGSAQAVYAPSGSSEDIIQNYQIVEDLSAVTGETRTIVETFSGLVIDYTTVVSTEEWYYQVFHGDNSIDFFYNKSENKIDNVEEDGEYHFHNINGVDLYQKQDVENHTLSLLFANPSFDQYSYYLDDYGYCTSATTEETFTHTETTYEEGTLVLVKGQPMVKEEYSATFCGYRIASTDPVITDPVVIVNLIYSGEGGEELILSMEENSEKTIYDAYNWQFYFEDGNFDNIQKYSFYIGEQEYDVYAYTGQHTRPEQYPNIRVILLSPVFYHDTNVSATTFFSATTEAQGFKYVFDTGETRIARYENKSWDAIVQNATPSQYFRRENNEWQLSSLPKLVELGSLWENEEIGNLVKSLYPGQDVFNNLANYKFYKHTGYGAREFIPRYVDDETGDLILTSTAADKDGVVIGTSYKITRDGTAEWLEEKVMPVQTYFVVDNTGDAWDAQEGALVHTKPLVSTDSYKVIHCSISGISLLEPIILGWMAVGDYPALWGTPEHTFSAGSQDMTTFVALDNNDGEYHSVTDFGGEFFYKIVASGEIEFKGLQEIYNTEHVGYEQWDEIIPVLAGYTGETTYRVYQNVGEFIGFNVVSLPRVYDFSRMSSFELGELCEQIKVYYSAATPFEFESWNYKFYADASESGETDGSVEVYFNKFSGDPTDDSTIEVYFTGAKAERDGSGIYAVSVKLSYDSILYEWVVEVSKEKAFTGPKSEVLTQAEYDALVQAGTVDPNTIYTII